jgi:hypothetical protein
MFYKTKYERSHIMFFKKGTIILPQTFVYLISSHKNRYPIQPAQQRHTIHTSREIALNIPRHSTKTQAHLHAGIREISKLNQLIKAQYNSFPPSNFFTLILTKLKEFRTQSREQSQEECARRNPGRSPLHSPFSNNLIPAGCEESGAAAAAKTHRCRATRSSLALALGLLRLLMECVHAGKREKEARHTFLQKCARWQNTHHMIKQTTHNAEDTAVKN